MPPINLLIKPASSGCNMVCDYCFYNDVAKSRLCGFKGFMNLEILEELVKQALDYAEGMCGFAFQGGEPTLVGLDFYRALVDFQKKYNNKNLRIHNAIQTNGYAITDQWAEFFRENQFLVGLSLDGTKEFHDYNRKDKQKKGTFNQVLKTAKLFDQYQVAYNILSVVTGRNAKHIESIYRFFRKQGFEYLQFIPCLEPFADENRESEYALTIEAYQFFLTKLFDLWFLELRRGKYISIRHLDNWLGILLGRPPEVCSNQGRCSIQFVVEGNGEVYPCDFYVLDQWLLGQIGKNSLAEIHSCEKARDFITESMALPEECKTCRYVQLCRNGCKRERVGKDNQAAKLYYCQAIKEFFSTREKELEQAAVILQRMMRNRLI